MKNSMKLAVALVTVVLGVGCGSDPGSNNTDGGSNNTDGGSNNTDGGSNNTDGGNNQNECTAGEIQTMACTAAGSSGSQQRNCGVEGVWGIWGDCIPDPLEPPIAGDVYYVSPSGPDIADDPSHGSDEAPWRSLQYAVDQLGPGDTLMVRRGYYAQSVTIHNGGTQGAPIVIRAEVPFDAKVQGGLIISADHVTVYGLDIEQPITGVGVGVDAVTGVQILRNKIHDCTSYGIQISPSASQYRIAGNVLSYVGQIGIRVNGTDGVIDGNQLLEIVAYHPKLNDVITSSGDDADGMTLAGSGHTIRGNIIANFADPMDVHNYHSEPVHIAHADCFDIRELNDTVIEGNHCWSNFHVSKGAIFNGSSGSRANVTIRNNIFEYRDIGLSAYEYPGISDLYVYNNLFKSQIEDIIESYWNPGSMASIPGSGIHIADITDYAVFNNITVDCDNHNDPSYTGDPVDIEGGTGVADYNFSWNSDGAAFSGADPGAHGSLSLDPGFVRYDTTVHGTNDYRLQSTSALMGLGTGSVSTPGGDLVSVTDDILGNARPEQGSYEPGPFEYLEGAPLLPRAPISRHVQNAALALTPTSCAPPASPVTVEVARWQGNREGAMVIQFDDSTQGQALCGLEALSSRNLTGTFYVNPGRDNFVDNRPLWNQAPGLGQELANHTMNHADVSGFAAWRTEVEDAADVIWTIRHGELLGRHGSLMAFNSSSSTSWNWAPWEKVSILGELKQVDRQTYMGLVYQANANPGYSVPQGSAADAMYCASTSLNINGDGDCVDSASQVVASGVTQAIQNSVVYSAAFHGILSTDTDNCSDYTSDPTSDGGNGGVQFSELESFLDSVVAVRDRIWVAGAIQLYKYTQEAQRSNIRMHQTCADRIYFDLATMLSPLYDEPLTLLVTVPSDWTSCAAIQGSRQMPCVIGADGRVMLDAAPNQGRIALFRSN